MKKIFIFAILSSFVSCSNFSYLLTSGKEQLKINFNKIPIEKALQEYDFTEEEKKKLNLVSEIKDYAKNTLEMDIDETIYSSYLELNDIYVTYLLRVSLAYELKAYTWYFPITGSVPYKGFFDKKEALKEAKSFPEEKYDIYIRGVTAYSTLGWFEDPILSSMLRYEEVDFTTMIFHELAHTVLFFKNNVNFNERFAEFIGRKASLLFYTKKEGENSEKVKDMLISWKEELLFSSFMVKEYENLNKWYKKNKGQITKEKKQKRIQEIQTRFLTQIQPQFQTNKYDYFPKIKLNNAKLLSYRSYNFNMEEFEKLFNSPEINQNIKAFIDYCFKFKSEENPEKALSQEINKLS
ncbi:MAG: aminopeptidase [Bdellovibrionales bacterium]|nr:aminopeptidase [Bdellovibrionales bacterium]